MNYNSLSYDGTKVYMTRVCPFCRQEHTVIVPYDAYERFTCNPGMHVEDAFPFLSAEDRELIISGIDIECWNTMVADYEED